MLQPRITGVARRMSPRRFRLPKSPDTRHVCQYPFRSEHHSARQGKDFGSLIVGTKCLPLRDSPPRTDQSPSARTGGLVGSGEMGVRYSAFRICVTRRMSPRKFRLPKSPDTHHIYQHPFRSEHHSARQGKDFGSLIVGTKCLPHTRLAAGEARPGSAATHCGM